MPKNKPDVSFVKLTKALFVPVLGQMSNATLSHAAYPGIQMWRTGSGIEFEHKGKRVLVPYSMIECIVLGDEPT